MLHPSSTTTSRFASRYRICCSTRASTLKRSRRQRRSSSPKRSGSRAVDPRWGCWGMSGPDLQQELKRRGQFIPIVFITAQGDKSLRPQLIGRGAVAVLFKPFTDDCVTRRGQRRAWDEVGRPRCLQGASDAGHLTTLIAEVRSTGYAEASPSRAVSQRTCGHVYRWSSIAWRNE